jgi:hypothetical protein
VTSWRAAAIGAARALALVLAAYAVAVVAVSVIGDDSLAEAAVGVPRFVAWFGLAWALIWLVKALLDSSEGR